RGSRRASRGSDPSPAAYRRRAVRRACGPWPHPRSPASGERVAAPELIDGAGELGMLGPREGGIAGEDAIGLFRSFSDELGIDIREIDDAQLGDTRLPLAEELAGTTDREIAFRKVEPIERHLADVIVELLRCHRVQTLG